MILENFILVEVLAILFFLIAFFKRNLLSWVVSAILFGANVLSAFAIEKVVYNTLENGTIIYETFIHSYAPMAYINIMFFAVCVLYALGDAITERRYQTIEK